MEFTEKIFKLKENKTTIRTEILAGITTFFTMSYLFVLSPKLLETAGMDLGASITALGIVVFICSLLMGLIANKPYATAPFLGETAFIAYTLVNINGFSVKTVFSAIFICGIALLLMTIFNIREFLVNKIPDSIKLAFCIGLGLFFIFIALKDIGIVSFTQNSIPIQAGNYTNPHIILGIICFSLIIILVNKGIKTAVLIAIAITTIIGVLIKDVTLPSSLISIPNSMSSSFMQFDFSSILNKNFISLFFVLFILVNIDTSGAIVSLEYNSGLKNTNLKKTMISDSIAVIISPIFGTTTSGAYLDSMTGIKAGGKTGISSITTGILFLIGLIFTPVIMIIPPYAYAPALIYVGILMISAFRHLNYDDISEFAPAIFTISAMVLTYNIGTGIMTGFLIYPIIKLLCSKKHETNIIQWILCLMSIIFFIIYPY